MKEQFDLLIQYLQAIWLQRRWIVISLWVICPLGWITVTLMPNQYSAEARVYADTQSILQPLLRGIAIDTDPSQELALMIKTLLSRPNLEKKLRVTPTLIFVPAPTKNSERSSPISKRTYQ